VKYFVVRITLVYPYFQPRKDNSIFRFPPLGLGYIAATLKKRGFSIDLVDCTFLKKNEAIEKIKRSCPHIIGIYSMFSMKKTSLEMAHLLRGSCDLLVAGGPLPSLNPREFLGVFDVVVIGEGEETMVELAESYAGGLPFSRIEGIAYNDVNTIRITAQRGFIANLDLLSFPMRELFDNESYKRYYKKHFGYTATPLITSRGCPFTCDFCSRPVFGNKIRARSPENIVSEVKEIVDLGYDRIWFADDCFTLDTSHLKRVCNLLVDNQVNIGWDCLSRVDTLDLDVAKTMKRAGCKCIYFGIESGNDSILALMNKQITAIQARRAVCTAKEAGLQVGAFFILGYPGETDQTVLETVKFASHLPLDYLSFTLPYPIPGTGLHERVEAKGFTVDDWEEPKNWGLIRHKLLFGSNLSERKLKFAIAKAQLQFKGRRLLGAGLYKVFGRPLEDLTDIAFELIR
jgi:anaerobic magnesium-protoporphyrin IX monomethyl ester cyclase